MGVWVVNGCLGWFEVFWMVSGCLGCFGWYVCSAYFGVVSGCLGW